MTKLSLTSIILLFIFGCEKLKPNSVNIPKSVDVVQQVLPNKTPVKKEKNPIEKIKETLPASSFMSAEWVDLMPKDDLDALLNTPSYIDDIVENSTEDQLSNSLKNEKNNNEADRYQQALASTRVIPEVDGAAIRIPAFIVPLEFDDEQKVTQFFMVPFFGACIHLPPPPPNQTIYVNYPQGLTLESLVDAYWISGILKTSLVENELAIAAYSMEVHAFELYDE